MIEIIIGIIGVALILWSLFLLFRLKEKTLVFANDTNVGYCYKEKNSWSVYYILDDETIDGFKNPKEIMIHTAKKYGIKNPVVKILKYN